MASTHTHTHSHTQLCKIEETFLLSLQLHIFFSHLLMWNVLTDGVIMQTLKSTSNGCKGTALDYISKCNSRTSQFELGLQFTEDTYA